MWVKRGYRFVFFSGRGLVWCASNAHDCADRYGRKYYIFIVKKKITEVTRLSSLMVLNFLPRGINARVFPAFALEKNERSRLFFTTPRTRK